VKIKKERRRKGEMRPLFVISLSILHFPWSFAREGARRRPWGCEKEEKEEKKMG